MTNRPFQAGDRVRFHFPEGPSWNRALAGATGTITTADRDDDWSLSMICDSPVPRFDGSFYPIGTLCHPRPSDIELISSSRSLHSDWSPA